MQIAELERPICDVVPYIFKRPVLCVKPSDSLLQVATYLAIGPHIYVDGLAVIDGFRAVGRIGGSHIIQYVLEHPDEWFDARASELMSQPAYVVDAGEDLKVALDIFARTKFAYVPIAIGGRVGTSLCVRDVLRLVADRVTFQVGGIASHLVSVNDKTSLKDGLELMLEKRIRNLALINEQGITKIVTDRKILEFLLSHDGRRMVAGKNGLESVGLDKLDLLNPKFINNGTMSGIAAEYLSDISTPCLLLPENRILTPWDIVMKGVGT